HLKQRSAGGGVIRRQASITITNISPPHREIQSHSKMKVNGKQIALTFFSEVILWNAGIQHTHTHTHTVTHSHTHIHTHRQKNRTDIQAGYQKCQSNNTFKMKISHIAHSSVLAHAVRGPFKACVFLRNVCGCVSIYLCLCVCGSVCVGIQVCHGDKSV